MKKDKLVFPRTKENQFGNNLRSQFRICVNQYSLEQPQRATMAAATFWLFVFMSRFLSSSIAAPPEELPLPQDYEDELQ